MVLEVLLAQILLGHRVRSRKAPGLTARVSGRIWKSSGPPARVEGGCEQRPVGPFPGLRPLSLGVPNLRFSFKKQWVLEVVLAQILASFLGGGELFTPYIFKLPINRHRADVYVILSMCFICFLISAGPFKVPPGCEAAFPGGSSFQFLVL